MLVTCHACGTSQEFNGPLGRRDLCRKCEAELRCCLMCERFDSGASRGCREPMAEPPRERDRANFCEFFEARSGPAGNPSAQPVDPRAAFEALFKKK